MKCVFIHVRFLVPFHVALVDLWHDEHVVCFNAFSAKCLKHDSCDAQHIAACRAQFRESGTEVLLIGLQIRFKGIATLF